MEDSTKKLVEARIDEKAEYTMVGRNMIKHFETLVVGDGRIAEVYRADIIRHFLDWLV